ncbi:hypothetical protein EKK97_03670 [Billgrantia tianxiuensis]|uniref:Uncharacterized protein n=1 Tax=Billgrantia tianxiuensis TaxID=2497861 RepID=A0A6I6SJS9_9GAMM|nr:MULTISPECIES: hypothetical protein [Halomonas]MCE8033117.1 hypothetical protein [Halomonas sp. MCCC 1A11057]QHC48886.1 hypothetical protein EKK97_03670 [Halomonas tianxiuensis]
MSGRSFIRKIQEHAIWRSVAEVFFAVVFTFGPIALLSVPLTGGDGDLSRSTVGNNFWSYWTSGELALPILGLCGAIAALAVVNSRALNRGLIFLAWISALMLASACGYALSKSQGFTQGLYPQVVWFGFIAYGVLLFLWLILSVKANSGVERTNPDERANVLLKRKHEMLKEGGRNESA